MKQFWLTLFAMWVVLEVFAQGSFAIKGKVHLEDGAPVSHVTIRLEGTNHLAISDKYGRYEFKAIPKGKYNLLLSSVNMNPKRLPIDVNKNYLDLHIHIDPKGDLALDEVRIERKTVKKEIETSGFAVAVIETKEASLRNLTTNELLDRTVGVRVRQNGGEGASIEYNLNGMTGSTIGIFIDGLEISTYGSSFNLNNIPPAMIDRIEVYKGVLPAHLSGNYIGGAINVIMKKDASANSLNAAVSYGSFHTFRTDLGAMYRNSKNGFTARISGFYSYSANDYEMWGKFSKYTKSGGGLIRNNRTRRPNDKFESLSGRFEFGFTDVKWADQFFVGYNISDTYKDIPHGLTMTVPYYGRFNEYQAHVLNLNYSKRNFFLEGLSLQVNAAQSYRSTYLQDTVSRPYNWAKEGSGSSNLELQLLPPNTAGEILPQPYAPGQGQQGEAVMTDINRTITNIRSNLSYMIMSGHRLSFNHKYESTIREDKDLLKPERSRWITQNDLRNNIFAMNYEAETFGGKLRTNVFGKYGIYHSIQNKPLHEVNGQVEYERTKTTRDNKGFGATASYEVVRHLFAIISAEKSFIMPTERHIYGEPENNLLPNANILPEMAINYNLGGRYALNTSMKHRFSFYGNMFWRNGYDKIIQQTRTEEVIDGRENQVEDIQVTQFVNLEKTQSVGFEAEVNYIYDNRLNAMVNFSRFNSLFKVKMDEKGKPHSLYDLQIPNEPFFTVNANVQYRFDGVFQKKSTMNLYYNMGYVAPFKTIWFDSDWFTTPTQFTHDVGVSYRFPKVNLVTSLDCKNIFNAEIYDNFGVQKPGRAVYIKLNYTINSLRK